jgi:HEAT repeat protein
MWRRSVAGLAVSLLSISLLASAWAVAASARPEDVPELIATVLTGPSVAADRAAERLRYLGPQVAGPPLRALLASPDSRARIAASSALIIVRDPASASALQRVLKDEDWEVRRNAVTALSTLESRAVVPSIERVLRTDEKVYVRKACVKALESLKSGVGGLADASASDKVMEIRLGALDVLARLKDHAARGKLRPLLGDSSEFVRFAAARALAWQDDPVAHKFIDKAVASKDVEEVRRAIVAISDVTSPWASALLEKALQSTDRSVACAAATGLARQHSKLGLRYLAKMERLEVPESAAARHTLDELGIGPAERARLIEESK